MSEWMKNLFPALLAEYPDLHPVHDLKIDITVIDTPDGPEQSYEIVTFNEEKLGPFDQAALMQNCIDFVADERRTVICGEAHRRIVDICPEWKQRNLIARGTELAMKVCRGGSLTTEENAEIDAGQLIWDQIKAIRAASDVLEAGAATDITNDNHWPAAPS